MAAMFSKILLEPWAECWAARWDFKAMEEALAKPVQRFKAKVKTLFDGDSLSLAKAYLTPSGLRPASSLFAPLVSCMALIGLVFSSAWAVTAFFHLLTALFAVYFILTRVFEIRLDLNSRAPF